jgi:hypothetical protein
MEVNYFHQPPLNSLRGGGSILRSGCTPLEPDDPPPLNLKSATMFASSDAWLLSSSAALADSSELAAFC